MVYKVQGRRELGFAICFWKEFVTFYDMDEAIYRGLGIGYLIVQLTKNRERDDETMESMRSICDLEA
jgi:hypothetical protein